MNENQEPLPGPESPLLATDPPPANRALSGEISPEMLHDPFGEEVLDITRGDFESMLNEHQIAAGDIREGQIVRARVLRITEASVILEFGFKSEGAVPLDEFKEQEAIEVGQEVEVLLESLEDDDGVVVLSKKKADFLRVWELIKDAHENDRPVKGLLTRKIKGGVTVDIMGVDAFLPGSQIALRRVPNIEDLIGESYDFMIIKLNKRRRNIVVSRRVILEGERKKKRTTLVKELLVGQVREGIVKNITDFGAFIDLGGLDGLLHITDMSWGRVGHPSEVVTIGSRIDVKVLDIDWDRERISLGLKQLLPYPWTDIGDRYPVGARVRGKVVSITNYGAFVELQKGVEGLVHISEMSWTRNVRHPSKIVSIGDEIETVVLKVDPKDEKISLGMKQIEEDPWLALPVKYPTGTRLTGTVRNLTSFGAFVEIESGIDGLVHVSDMSWTRRVEHPSEVVQKGVEVEVMVLDVDSDNKRISLGIKQLYDDPWPELVTRFTKGYEVDGRVARLQDKGVVMDLGDGVEGFVPGSHSAVPADSLEDYFQPGDTVSLRVIASDASDRRIVLEVLSAPERRKASEPEAAADDPEAAGDEPEAAADDPEAAGDEPEAADDSEAAADEPEAAEDTEAVADEPQAAEDTEAVADEPQAAADDSEAAADEPEAAAEAEPEAAADDEPEAAADDEPEAAADDEPEAAADDAEAAGDEPEAAETVADEEEDPTDE